MSFPFQLQIPKRNTLCWLREEPLTEGMAYYSLLSENGEARKDFCVSCWKEFSKTEAGKDNARYWKSKVPHKKAKAVLPQDKDAHVFAHFKKMMEENLGETEEERFLLSLYLARRRLIALRNEKKEGDVILQLYEVVEKEEFFTVKKMSLLKDEIETIQQRIAKKLQHEP